MRTLFQQHWSVRNRTLFSNLSTALVRAQPHPNACLLLRFGIQSAVHMLASLLFYTKRSTARMLASCYGTSSASAVAWSVRLVLVVSSPRTWCTPQNKKTQPLLLRPRVRRPQKKYYSRSPTMLMPSL